MPESKLVNTFTSDDEAETWVIDHAREHGIQLGRDEVHTYRTAHDGYIVEFGGEYFTGAYYTRTQTFTVEGHYLYGLERNYGESSESIIDALQNMVNEAAIKVDEQAATIESIRNHYNI